jgi:O-acetyl-ADP-ribose deacetylase (regulator of RNase III)
MITHVVGDILKESVDGFIHQANCQCTMGSGVAKSVREIYPEVYKADLNTKRGDESKMGSFSFAKTHDNKIGYNLYSQFNYGTVGDELVHTNYDSMKKGLMAIREHIKANMTLPVKIAIPFKIGCVRGGEKWEKVSKLISELFDKEPDITIVICQLEEFSIEEGYKSKLRKAYKHAELMNKLEDVERE